jgi:hypothetical protein
VKRYGFMIRGWNLDARNRCRACGHLIPIVGRLPDEYEPTFVQPLA